MRAPEIPALTGLRGVAALMVVINHYAAGAAPFALLESPAAFWAAFSLPGFGMSLFFTLSGFMMFYHYSGLAWRARPISSALEFAWLRVSRLYPSLLLFLFLCATPALIHGADGRWWTALHVLSLDTLAPVKIAGWQPGTGPFHVSWSIGTEMAMYAVFAALMIIAAAHRSVALTLIAGYVVVVLYLMSAPSAVAALAAAVPAMGDPLDTTEWGRWFWYLSPYYRLLEFGLGAVAAFALLRRSALLDRHARILRALSAAAVVGLTALHASWFISPIRPSIPGLQLTSACLFAAVILASRQDTWINRILASRPLVVTGLASYSLYLFHSFIPASAVFGSGAPFAWDLVPSMLVNLGVRLAMAVAMCWGLYHLWERPAQDWLRRLMPDRIKSPSAARSAVLAPAE